jgi:hypothetical protein
MAAPIHRYSDLRLYGTTFVKPFNYSYQWIKTVGNPLHPQCNLIAECAIRAIKLLIGTVVMTGTALPASIGRIIQITHYHFISKAIRLHPPKISINDMELPSLQPCTVPQSEVFHGTEEKGAIGILRWGFDPHKTKEGSKIGEAVYASAVNTVSSSYGSDQFILSLNLRENEVAYLDDDTLMKFSTGKDFSNKKTMTAIRELFLKNGYRAIQYTINHHGKEKAWAIYDVSCISIIRVQPSPTARHKELLLAVQ